jgi:protein ImuB
MPRIVSVWLDSWPIARFLRAQAGKASAAPSDAVDPRRPFVLVAPGAGGARLVALNTAAWRCGLAAGELLSSARAKALDLQSRDVDPAADEAALRQLALWCLRYTPVVVPWNTENGADGLFLDITGCAHLFGGEESLLADLANRLRRFGLHPRLAVADTAGAAWAVARFGDTDNAIVPPDGQETVLRNLPLAALRLDEEAQATLCRLGFRRIGELMRQPRAPLVARFGASLLVRLDQALGYAAEPLSPLHPPPFWHAQAQFMEAITTQADVVEATTRLLRQLAQDLARDAVGARLLRLLLFRPDGGVLSLDIGLAAPSRDVAHIARLVEMRLDRLPAGLETDFGYEAAAIHVLAAERIAGRQTSLGFAGDAGEPAGLASLIDRLEHRLGSGSVRRLHPRQSHIPERAVAIKRAAEGPAPGWRIEAPFGARPPLLLAPPEEAAEIMAIVPEGPPRRFRWRGALHDVAHAQGPERIAPEWWRPDLTTFPRRGKVARGAGRGMPGKDSVQGESPPDVFEHPPSTPSGHLPPPEEGIRDYYVVEDMDGRRFWLYRSGLYGIDQPSPRWFVHGVFP